MPQSITIAAFAFGALLLLIAIVGGNFKLFGAEVSERVGSNRLRVFAGLLGLALIFVGLFNPMENRLVLRQPNPVHGSTTDTSPHSVSTGHPVVSIVFSTDSLEFPSGQCINLDTGQEYCGYDYDIVEPLGGDFIGPASGAQTRNLGKKTLDEFVAIDVPNLQGLDYGGDPVLKPRTGQAFAVRTSRGNFAKVQLVTDLPTRILRITTYHLASQ